MNSATPIKRKPPLPNPSDKVEQCVKDMRKVYPELTESQLITLLEKKYKIPWKRSKAILSREENHA